MARQIGPTKGIVVLNNPETAESLVLEAEPYTCTDTSEYNSLINGTATLTAKVVEDQLGVKHVEFTLTPSGT